MKRLITLTILGLATVSSFAQSPSSINFSGLTVRLGGIYPWEKKTRSVTGNMLAVGLSIPMPRPLLSKGESYVSIDWYGKSAGGAKGNMFPVMINQRFFMDPNEDEGRRSYFDLGLGIVHMDITSAKTVPGLRAVMGKELSDKLIGEIALVLSGDANKAKANSIGFFLGWKL
jgi:hypothetical protein